MKNFVKLCTLTAFLSITLFSCDYIEEPTCLDCQAQESEMKVVLEDFTGHMCGFCPQAHKVADQLKEDYGDNLIVITIHATGLARQFPAAGYHPDYTTDMGDEIEEFFDAETEGFPVGMINRRTWTDGKIPQKAPNWGSYISAILSETPMLSLEVTANVTNDENLSSQARITYFEEAPADHQLVMVITEDSIFSKQSDYDQPSGEVENYHHKHMLRGSVTNGTWGERLKSDPIEAGEIFELDYSMEWNADWDPNNCHLVAYIIDNTTKEIIQAEEISLTE